MTHTLAKSTLVAAGSALAMTGLLAGCNLWGDAKPAPPTKTSTLQVYYTYGSLGADRCTGTVTWTLEPQALTGEPGGQETTVQETRSYEQSAESSKECQFAWGATGLRTGQWLLSSSVGACQVTVKAPTTVVRMKQYTPGCQQS